MKIRESKHAKNHQIREAMEAIDDARHLIRTGRSTKFGQTMIAGATLDNVDDKLTKAVGLLWDVRNDF